MTSLRQFRSALPAVSRPRVALAAVEMVAVAGLATALATRRWDQMGALPTGLDAGNWLAFGRGMFGDGKSTAGAYPPLVPLLATLCRAAGETFDGLRVLAIASLLVPAFATYLVTRPAAGPWFAAGAAAIVAMARPFGEATAFGGYPQNLAAGFGLVAAGAGAAYLVDGRPRYALVAAAALALTALTHHLYFVFSVAWLGAVAALWVLPPGAGSLQRLRSRATLALAPAAGLAAFLPTWVLIARAGYSPPFNAAETSLWDSWEYATGGESWLWAAIAAVALAGIFAGARDPRARPLWLVAAGALAAGLGGFAATGEGRLLALVFFGVAGGVALAGHALNRRLAGTVLAGVPQALVLGLVFVVPYADDQAREDFAYYRTLEPGMIGAARWLDANAEDETAVVGASGRGWPMGWWFEGLTGDARIVVGSDLRWVAFSEERDNARLAREFFAFARTEAEVRALGEREGVRYLVFSTADWTGWQDWDAEPAFTYVSGTYRVLDLHAAHERP